jgi:hypothetical protein
LEITGNDARVSISAYLAIDLQSQFASPQPLNMNLEDLASTDVGLNDVGTIQLFPPALHRLDVTLEAIKLSQALLKNPLHEQTDPILVVGNVLAHIPQSLKELYPGDRRKYWIDRANALPTHPGKVLKIRRLGNWFDEKLLCITVNGYSVPFGINFLQFTKGMQPVKLFQIIAPIFDPEFSETITSSEDLKSKLIAMFGSNTTNYIVIPHSP